MRALIIFEYSYCDVRVLCSRYPLVCSQTLINKNTGLKHKNFTASLPIKYLYFSCQVVALD